jgi:hypothetical protein
MVNMRPQAGGYLFCFARKSWFAVAAPLSFVAERELMSGLRMHFERICYTVRQVLRAFLQASYDNGKYK